MTTRHPEAPAPSRTGRPRGRKGSGSPADHRLEDHLCFALYQANHAFTAAYRPLLAPLGLTYPQYLVLLLLWEADGLSVAAIGQRLGLDSGTLTPLLRRMEAQGLLNRARHPGDERQLVIALTPKGRAFEAKAEGVRERMRCRVGADAPALRDALRVLAETLRVPEPTPRRAARDRRGG